MSVRPTMPLDFRSVTPEDIGRRAAECINFYAEKETRHKIFYLAEPESQEAHKVFSDILAIPPIDFDKEPISIDARPISSPDIRADVSVERQVAAFDTPNGVGYTAIYLYSRS